MGIRKMMTDPSIAWDVQVLQERVAKLESKLDNLEKRFESVTTNLAENIVVLAQKKTKKRRGK